ncbi:hypothetical protein [Absidia glauca]|uniref:1-phosphatidylinositol-4-phosphate 5-kinase n=1 Tax=Absidia glauca TaxID=4829 RepID=A0A163K3F8_ABSGL|nr:hypothetical protein [Absidia glauca]
MPLSACATQTLHENTECGGILSTSLPGLQPSHDPSTVASPDKKQHDPPIRAVSLNPTATGQELSDLSLDKATCTPSGSFTSASLDDTALAPHRTRSVETTPSIAPPRKITTEGSLPATTTTIPPTAVTTATQTPTTTPRKTMKQPLTIHTNNTDRRTSLTTSVRSPYYRSPSMASSGGGTRIDLGPLNHEEEAVLEAEIAARRAARRSRRRKHYADTDDEDDQIQIGTRVAEGHRNYHLMYDMLTGIRIAVGRVSAKIRRDPIKDDFTAAHKLVFDVTGNELTPGVKYDFKFKDYAPWVFRNLREIFHIDAADYLMSLTHKYILSELGSPGKSGSFFYYSRDYRFIIKTIHHSEHVFMRKILMDYYDHVKRNPNTLLCRIYGLHRIKLPRGRKIHFVVMGNVFPSNKNVHETYDLKGSMFGRLTTEDEINKNPYAVMKDQNWVNRGKKMELGPEKRHLFLTQLQKDVEVLIRLNIMDYSLLIGIHMIEKGNDERFRDQRLQIIEARNHGLERQASKFKAAKYTTSIIPLTDSAQLSTNPSQERRNCVFYADNGGFQSSNRNDEDADLLYFIGVIDIFTPYNFVKRSEHLWKSITQDKNTISSVPPKFYGQRFLRFVEKAIPDHQSA